MNKTETRERPILFKAPMVRAILADRKTNTRRMIAANLLGQPNYCLDTIESDRQRILEACPYGSVGDRLWVREAWGVGSIYDGIAPRNICQRLEKGPGRPPCKVAYPASGRYEGVKFRPSIHMPRWASRITLKLTAVRVERLRDMTSEDAIAEGIEFAGMPKQLSPKTEFAKYWETINGTGSWLSNPWVWVIEFRRIKEGNR